MDSKTTATSSSTKPGMEAASRKKFKDSSSLIAFSMKHTNAGTSFSAASARLAFGLLSSRGDQSVYQSVNQVRTTVFKSFIHRFLSKQIYGKVPAWVDCGWRNSFVAVTMLVIGIFGLTLDTQAAAFTDTIKLTVGGNEATEGAGFNKASGFGSVTPSASLDGLAYSAFYSVNEVCVGSGSTKRCTAARTVFSLSGLSSNPGQSWLTSITPASPSGTLIGSNATYTYSGGTATWLWSGQEYVFSIGSQTTVAIVHGDAPLGYFDLKYQIIGVDYAPPGSSSTVSYGSSAMQGTGTSSSSAIKNTTTVTTQTDIGADIFSLDEDEVTSMTTSSYSQQYTNSESISIATTTSTSDTVRGPQSSADGIDHDYDVIWVWVNPAIILYVGPNAVSADGYAFDYNDPAHTMHVIPLYTIWLKEPSTMPTSVSEELARNWDTTGLGGLTSADYQQILDADPFFASSNYNPNSDTSGRFDMVIGTTIPYEQAPAGGQPITVTGSIATQKTTTLGQASENSYSVGISLNFSAKLSIFATLKTSLKISDTWVTTNTWSSTINSQTGLTAGYSVTGPAAGSGYTGPASFQVWRDNVYGSFMFYPVAN